MSWSSRFGSEFGGIVHGAEGTLSNIWKTASSPAFLPWTQGAAGLMTFVLGFAVLKSQVGKIESFSGRLLAGSVGLAGIVALGMAAASAVGASAKSDFNPLSAPVTQNDVDNSGKDLSKPATAPTGELSLTPGGP